MVGAPLARPPSSISHHVFALALLHPVPRRSRPDQPAWAVAGWPVAALRGGGAVRRRFGLHRPQRGARRGRAQRHRRADHHPQPLLRADDRPDLLLRRHHRQVRRRRPDRVVPLYASRPPASSAPRPAMCARNAGAHGRLRRHSHFCRAFQPDHARRAGAGAGLLHHRWRPGPAAGIYHRRQPAGLLRRGRTPCPGWRSGGLR